MSSVTRREPEHETPDREAVPAVLTVAPKLKVRELHARLPRLLPRVRQAPRHPFNAWLLAETRARFPALVGAVLPATGRVKLRSPHEALGLLVLIDADWPDWVLDGQATEDDLEWFEDHLIDDLGVCSSLLTALAELWERWVPELTRDAEPMIGGAA